MLKQRSIIINTGANIVIKHWEEVHELTIFTAMKTSISYANKMAE